EDRDDWRLEADRHDHEAERRRHAVRRSRRSNGDEYAGDQAQCTSLEPFLWRPIGGFNDECHMASRHERALTPSSKPARYYCKIRAGARATSSLEGSSDNDCSAPRGASRSSKSEQGMRSPRISPPATLGAVGTSRGTLHAPLSLDQFLQTLALIVSCQGWLPSPMG